MISTTDAFAKAGTTVTLLSFCIIKVLVNANLTDDGYEIYLFNILGGYILDSL